MPSRRPDPAIVSSGPPVSPGDVRVQLDRILESRWFRNAQRLRRFLQFAVACALEGTVDQLKESVLGRVVFDRGSHYDPRTDSIVRVESQRLRRRLRDYYENEGSNDTVSIAFQSGSYVPRFSYIEAKETAIIPGERVVGSRLNPLTIAVLPFENLSSEPDQDFFCDGVTEDVIFALSRIPGVNVIGRTSVFALKGIAYDVRDTGVRLGAGTVVDGSVRRSGSSVRIFAEMIDAETRHVRWADTFDRTIDDVFAVQSEIAQTIARVLHMTLAPPVSNRLIRGAPSMDAYLLYLKGRYAWNRMSRQGFGTALDVFEEAISLYPDYASLYAGLADVYGFMALWGEVRPKDAYEKALNAAERAIELDPLLGQAYSAAAVSTAFYRWHWTEGTALARRALDLEPSYGFGLHVYGTCLLVTGHVEEGHGYLEGAVALDPLSVRANRMLGWSFFLQRRHASAEKWLEAALEMHSEPVQTRYMLGLVLLAQRRFNDALGQAQRAQTDPPDPFTLGLLGACHAYLGRRDEAWETARKLEQMAERSYIDPHAVGLVYIALGETGLALGAIAKMIDERTPSSIFLEMAPTMDPLRGEPKFKEMIAQIRPKAASSTPS